MNLKGNVWKFGNNIDTDAIIPARYLNTSSSAILSKHCMEDARKGFSNIINNNDIILAGKNFGCGSSREHAPICIKALGISCVIAKSFARIFYRNAINIGLPIFECESAYKYSKEGDLVSININTGKIFNLTTNKIYQSIVFPEFMRNLIKNGGLIKYIKKQITK